MKIKDKINRILYEFYWEKKLTFREAGDKLMALFKEFLKKFLWGIDK